MAMPYGKVSLGFVSTWISKGTLGRVLLHSYLYLKDSSHFCSMHIFSLSKKKDSCISHRNVHFVMPSQQGTV